MPLNINRCVATLAILSLCITSVSAKETEDLHRQTQGVRTIVTTDPELDDKNSLIRLLLYSNELEIEGLITASSGVHWKGDGKGTKHLPEDGEDRRFGLNICPCTDWRWYDGHIEEVVDAYDLVFENLKVHDQRYPSPESLRAVTRMGNVAFPGDYSEDSPGSKLIRDVLLDRKPGPVYLQVWGGPSTVASALRSIEQSYTGTEEWRTIREKISNKAVIVSFGQQDSSYQKYVAKAWPDVQLWQLATTTWGYGARNVVLEENAKYLGTEWTAENVSSRGPLGAIYRVWGDGKQMVEDDRFDHFGYAGLTGTELRRRGYIVWTPVQQQGSWVSEGDTSTFMNLLQNGLRSYVHPGWGGWGGRAVQSQDQTSVWEGREAVDYNEFNGAREDYAAARWFAFAQDDFAARLRWSTSDNFRDANHHPVIRDVTSDQEVSAGHAIRLTTSASDPDGDALSYTWWQYRETGTYPEHVPVDVEGAEAIVLVPEDAAVGDSMHVILAVTDNGEPKLTTFARVVLTVVD